MKFMPSVHLNRRFVRLAVFVTLLFSSFIASIFYFKKYSNVITTLNESAKGLSKNESNETNVKQISAEMNQNQEGLKISNASLPLEMEHLIPHKGTAEEINSPSYKKFSELKPSFRVIHEGDRVTTLYIHF